MFKTYPTHPELQKVCPDSIKRKISALRNFFNDTENLYSKKIDAINTEIKKYENEPDVFDDEWQYVEKYSEIIAEEITEIELDFVRTNRYLAIVALHSYLESSLISISKEVALVYSNESKLDFFINKKGSKIKNLRDFLELTKLYNFGEVKKSWEHLLLVATLRNCIAHTNGDIRLANQKIQSSIKQAIANQHQPEISFFEQHLLMLSENLVRTSFDHCEIFLIFLSRFNK